MSTHTTQRFEGHTIEEALSAAVSSFGEQLDIIDAQRVRRGGVMGFFAKECFEVVAAPRLDDDARFEAVLSAMVDRVDAAEGGDPALTSRRDPTWEDADFVLPAPDLPTPGSPIGPLWIDEPEVSPAEQLVAALADVFAEDEAVGGSAFTSAPAAVASATPPDDTPESSEFQPAAPESSGTRPDDTAGPGDLWWDRTALVRLGVPDQILAALPPESPASDLGWVAALASAIERSMPSELAAMTKVEITANGVDGVVDLLRGATAGFRPTRIVVDGHSVAATPLEMALAVRACLRREAA